MMKIVDAQDLYKIYDNGQISFEALKGVSLQIEATDFIVLVGPSGSGKTTLLNLIGCLDQPTQGKIILNGKSLERLSQAQLAMERNLNLGFIFQSFNLISVLNALENVEFPLFIRKMNHEERRRKAKLWLEAVGLSEFGNHHPNQLSGGQQQRVAIARALVGEPKLVLADEPTANLDSKTGESIVKLMKQLNQENGVTFLLSTHDERIIRFATKVVHLSDGKILGTI